VSDDLRCSEQKQTLATNLAVVSLVVENLFPHPSRVTTSTPTSASTLMQAHAGAGADTVLQV
jgi:hypothetical protein